MLILSAFCVSFFFFFLGAKKSITYSTKKLYKMTKGWLRKTS